MSIPRIRSAAAGISLLALAGMMTGCAGSAPQTLQLASTNPVSVTSKSCQPPAAEGIRLTRWGYYPGYGCGPVPPAQTIFP
jgi:hypothetical protein